MANLRQPEEDWLYVVMGPAGAGKSTIGSLLAETVKVPFLEGDSFHPPANVQKIMSGEGLTTKDREPWLAAIVRAVNTHEAPRIVLSCSALNDEIRRHLEEKAQRRVVFMLLDVPKAELLRRLKQREGHFAGPELLESQLAAMDDAPGISTFDATPTPEEVAGRMASYLDKVTRSC